MAAGKNLKSELKIERISKKGTLNERLGGEVMDSMKKKCSIERK